MPTIHDPYLDTVRRSLNNEKIKLRKSKIDAEQKFLSQKVTLGDYIYLPEELEKLFLICTFIFIPYIFGLLILFIIAFNEFQAFLKLNFDIFMLTWTVGYESMAILLLLTIIKSAFSFNKKNTNQDTLVQKTLQ